MGIPKSELILIHSLYKDIDDEFKIDALPSFQNICPNSMTTDTTAITDDIMGLIATPDEGAGEGIAGEEPEDGEGVVGEFSAGET